MRTFYCHCLENSKVPVVSVNVARLKEHLLKLNSNLTTTSRKKEVFISVKDDLEAALEYPREHSLKKNVIYLNRAAYIIRIEIFEKHWHFTSISTDIWQNESVSALLLFLIHVITSSSDDLNSRNKLNENTHIPILSLSQLIHFNTVYQEENSETSHHSSAQETFGMYVTFLLHSQTLSGLLVDKFHDLPLCIFSDQKLVLSTQLGNIACT